MHLRALLPFAILHRIAAAFATGLACAALTAQTASPSAAPDADTLKLSTFEVTAANRGYGAPETMTGTRVKTQIIDLPYTVNVLTSEFFEDFGIFDLSDNITQIGGFTGLDIGSNFNLRGFTSTYQLRDGFFRAGRYGVSNIDRLEVIKGSNAAIYGRTSPGGMINMVSKRPKSAASQKLSFNTGDYDVQRTTLEATGPLLKGSLGQTNYILTGSYYQRKFDQGWSVNRNQEYYLALEHVFPSGARLFLSGEFFAQLRHDPIPTAPLIIDQKGTAATTDDVAVGYALNLARYSAFGPKSELNRGNTSFAAVFEHTLSPVFSTRLSANGYGARRWDYNQVGGWGTININPAGANPAIRSARGATPTRTQIDEDGGGFQGDLLAHYWTNNHQVEHRTLLTFDLNDYYQYPPSVSYGPATNPDIVAWNAVRTVTLDADYNPVGPIQYFPKWYYEGGAAEVYTRNRKAHTTSLGGLLRQQSAFFSGRLLAYAGARFDSVRFRHRDFLTPVPGYNLGDTVDRRVNELKPNLGVNYKLRPNFRVFANYSESYFVGQADTPQILADPDYAPEVANGWDYGFKGSLFDDKLTYTVSGYYINRHNVTVTDLEETPVGSGTFVQVSRRDGDQLVRGYEADVNWQVTDEISLLGSYGNVHSIYTDFGSAFPAAIGRPVTFIAPENGSISAKYSPARGRWRGFSANVSVTYVAATPTEQPTAGDTYATVNGQRVVTSSTGQWALRASSYSLWSLGARYQFQGKSKYTHTLAVNVSNLFDRDYLRVGSSTAGRLLGEHRAVYFTYTLGHKGALF